MQTDISKSPRADGSGAIAALLLLAGVLAIGATYFTYRQLVPQMETDLSSEVSKALAGSGIDDIQVTGQDVTLRGQVASNAARDEATKAAASVFGVNRITNELTVAGGTASPVVTASLTSDNGAQDTKGGVPSTLTLVFKGNKVIGQGIVSDAQVIDKINTALENKYGKNNVRNDMSSFEGSVAPDWTDGIVSLLDELDGIDTPLVKVTGADLVFGGSVNTTEIKNLKIAAAQRLLGDKLNVVDNIQIRSSSTSTTSSQTQAVESATVVSVVESATETPSLQINSKNNEIIVTGVLASEDEAATVRDDLDAAFSRYLDKLEVSSNVARADWAPMAIEIASQLQIASDFDVSVNNDQLMLSGTLEDRNTGRELAAFATESVGNKLDVLNNFKISNNSSDDLVAQSLMQEIDALPSESIVFNKGSTTLAEEARIVLDDIAASILGYEEVVLEIAGHTDSSGDAVRNLKLSKERAEAVRTYLIDQDVPANRLRAIGYGETVPLKTNDTAAGRAANRRIEFNL